MTNATPSEAQAAQIKAMAGGSTYEPPMPTRPKTVSEIQAESIQASANGWDRIEYADE
ncbi:hypothetical protein [Cryobacterium cheniae]|uniref:hypothetical protein n=1 Tax=Cryobacterium cheniae TaxID=1259262 RepID=UPI00141B3813|nr:hypothetical protein [Cryobacterium cheniae]